MAYGEIYEFVDRSDERPFKGYTHQDRSTVGDDPESSRKRKLLGARKK